MTHTDSPFGWTEGGTPALRHSHGPWIDRHDDAHDDHEITPARVAGPDEVVVNGSDLRLLFDMRRESLFPAEGDAVMRIRPLVYYATPEDEEEFCPKCFAGTESDEHHEKCARPMSAERLREAARVLRERAEGAKAGPWHWEHTDWHDVNDGGCVEGQDFGHHGPDLISPQPETFRDGDRVEEYPTTTVITSMGYDADQVFIDKADGDYIATMHPGVGLALADVLDFHARRFAEGLGLPGDYRKVFALADQILGDAV